MFNRIEYRKSYYKKNRAVQLQKSIEKYHLNREKILARRKELLQLETPEKKQKKAEYLRAYREKNRDRLKESIQSDKNKYAQYSFSANKRGYDFSLSQEEFEKIFHSDCDYCGKPDCRGIDRVDNNKGYSTENSTPCCEKCNKMKWRYTKEEFLEQIKNIYLRKLM
jgi:hypothetical protein